MTGKLSFGAVSQRMHQPRTTSRTSFVSPDARARSSKHPTPRGKETRPSMLVLRKRRKEVHLDRGVLLCRILAYAFGTNPMSLMTLDEYEQLPTEENSTSLGAANAAKSSTAEAWMKCCSITPTISIGQTFSTAARSGLEKNERRIGSRNTNRIRAGRFPGTRNRGDFAGNADCCRSC